MIIFLTAPNNNVSAIISNRTSKDFLCGAVIQYKVQPEVYNTLAGMTPNFLNNEQEHNGFPLIIANTFFQYNGRMHCSAIRNVGLKL